MILPKLIETRDVALLDIHIVNRLRDVNQVSVQSLMQSIEQVGLQSEIILRRVRIKNPDPDGPKYTLRLLAGGHRLTAFHELGFEAIPAKIFECTDDAAQLIEIDDNLAHAQLEPLDLALFLRERKTVYERMHPDTKQGNAGAAARWNASDNLSVASFITSTAQQMGQSERNVERIISAATRLNADHIAALRLAPRRVSHSDLQTIAKLTSSDDQDAVCIALSEGTAKSASEAMSQRRAQPGDVLRSASDKQLIKLNDAFARASMSARRQFIDTHSDTLRALLNDADSAEDQPVSVPHFTRNTGAA